LGVREKKEQSANRLARKQHEGKTTPREERKRVFARLKKERDGGQGGARRRGVKFGWGRGGGPTVKSLDRHPWANKIQEGGRRIKGGKGRPATEAGKRRRRKWRKGKESLRTRWVHRICTKVCVEKVQRER